MKKAAISAILVLFCGLLPLWAQRGDGPLDSSPPQGITVEEIIRRFAEKEKEFKQARDNYTYTQDVKVQTPEDGGEYREVFDVTFDDRGRRVENVKFAPQSTLRRVGITKEDLDDIRNLLPFVLTSDEIPEYKIEYVGRQRVDELGTYVFDIAPRQVVKGKRYFEGRIWVDDRDFQIVKTFGKPVPDRIKNKEGENLFPRFTTWREQIDGRYWFPTYTKADDTLEFSRSEPVRIREIIKYTNYKRFSAQTKITYEGQEIEKGEEKKPEEKK